MLISEIIRRLENEKNLFGDIDKKDFVSNVKIEILSYNKNMDTFEMKYKISNKTMEKTGTKTMMVGDIISISMDYFVEGNNKIEP